MPIFSQKNTALSLLCLSLACSPHPITAAPPVWLRGDRVELAILPAGGTLIDFRLRDRPLNPLNWEVPENESRRTQLPAGPRGHFLCLDRWGPPSPAEARRGVPFHGEAATGDWENTAPEATRQGRWELSQQRLLPLAGLRVDRRLTLETAGQVVHVEERVTNTAPLGRIYNMVQHPTIAPPFLDHETLIDSNASRGFCQDVPADTRAFFPWPRAQLGRTEVDLRQLEVEPGEQPVSDVCSFVFEESVEWGWVTACHPGRRLLLGYVWRTADYGWLNIWRFRQGEKRLARGLEFGTTGLHKPPAELLQEPQILGQPTYRFLDADEQHQRSYWLFLTPLPDAYLGVQDLIVTPSGIDLVERRPSDPRRISLPTRLLEAPN